MPTLLASPRALVALRTRRRGWPSTVSLPNDDGLGGSAGTATTRHTTAGLLDGVAVGQVVPDQIGPRIGVADPLFVTVSTTVGAKDWAVTEQPPLLSLVSGQSN